MRHDAVFAALSVGYVAIAVIVWGFCVAKIGPAGILIGGFIAAAWPASALFALGVWIA
jgi:hypothetical protein